MYAADAGIPLPHYESIKTMKAVWEQYLTRQFFATVSVFNYLLCQQINSSIGNLPRQQALGFEGELEYTWDNQARVRGSYTRQMAEDIQGDQLANSPIQLVKLNYWTPLGATPWWTAAEFQYVGARASLLDTGADDSVKQTIAGAGIVNMTVGYQGRSQIPTVLVSVYNLLGKQYYDPYPFDTGRDRIARNGRSFWLQLSLDF